MRSTRRPRATAALAVALLLTACGGELDLSESVPDVTPPASSGDTPTGGGTGTDTAGDAGQTTGQPDSGATDAAPTADGGATPATPAALPAAVNDLGGVGSHGPAMLRSSVPALVVEVDVQQGVSVDQGAVDTLVNRIREYTDKPSGVSVSGGNTFASDTTQWTTDQLRAAAAANRNHYSDASTVVVYVLYVDGGFFADGQQTNAIGVAYNASEYAVFPGRWSGLGSLLGSDRAIERSVLVHEWGHLLGLVNIGYQSRLDHEDADHPHHSSNRGSVMFWAIETDLIGQFFNGAPPDDFDDADREDMEGIRDGSLRS